ncbi:2578_t:CDS:2, partial [Acaulospora morrowiae]
MLEKLDEMEMESRKMDKKKNMKENMKNRKIFIVKEENENEGEKNDEIFEREGEKEKRMRKTVKYLWNMGNDTSKRQRETAELIIELKKTKSKYFSELTKSYMDNICEATKQNSILYDKANDSLNKMTSENLPESVKKTIADNYNRITNEIMSSIDIFNFASKEAKKLNIQDTEEYIKLINILVDNGHLDSKDKEKLLNVQKDHVEFGKPENVQEPG